MKKTRRLLSLILVFAMLCAMLPATVASAAEPTPSYAITQGSTTTTYQSLSEVYSAMGGFTGTADNRVLVEIKNTSISSTDLSTYADLYLLYDSNRCTYTTVRYTGCTLNLTYTKTGFGFANIGNSLEFVNCVFNNYGIYGYNVGTDANHYSTDVVFDGCTFTTRGAIDSGGCWFGDIKIKDCHFLGDEKYAVNGTSGYEGAYGTDAYGGTATLEMTGCDFSETFMNKPWIKAVAANGFESVTINNPGYEFFMLRSTGYPGQQPPEYYSESLLNDGKVTSSITYNKTTGFPWFLAYTPARIVYDGNAPQGKTVTGATKDANAYKPDDTFTVKTNGFACAGYTFKGWNTKADNSGTSYAPNATGTVQWNAADNVLYAQWEEGGEAQFTIVHSSDKSEETLDVTDYPGTLDITERVTDGYIYGGLYNEDFSEVYDEDGWKEDYSGDYNGKALTPTAGDVYYLKEVPSTYLRPKTLSFYNGEDDKTHADVKYSYMITIVDSLNYAYAGFDINGASWKTAVNNDTVYEELEAVTNKGTSTLNPSNFASVDSGYIVCDDVTSALKGYQQGKTDLSILPYFVTIDGVKVTGTVERTMNYQEVGLPVVQADTTVDSVTSKYVEEPAKLMRMLSLAPNLMLGVPETGEEETPETYTITKIVNGKTEEQIVEAGSCVGEITYPEAAGKVFAGWFMDAGYKTPADFTDIESDMTVYAKYVSDAYLNVYAESKSGLLTGSKIEMCFAVPDTEFESVGFVYEAKGEENVLSVDSYSQRMNLKTARVLFGSKVAKDAKLVIGSIAAAGMTNGTSITVRAYWTTLDGTTVYGQAETVTCRKGLLR